MHKKNLKKIHSDIELSSGVEAADFPPTFHVTSKQIPEVQNWEVGEKYMLVVEVEQKSKSEHEDQPTTGSFEIVAYKVLKNKTIEQMSDEEFAKEYN